MTLIKLFPAIMIAESLLAAAIYAYQTPGDWRHICYWLFAAGITYVINF